MMSSSEPLKLFPIDDDEEWLQENGHAVARDVGVVNTLHLFATPHTLIVIFVRTVISVQ